METCPWSCILATRGPSTGTDPLHTPHRRTSVKLQPPDPGGRRVPCWLRTHVLRGLDEMCGEVVELTRKLGPRPAPRILLVAPETSECPVRRVGLPMLL